MTSVEVTIMSQEGVFSTLSTRGGWAGAMLLALNIVEAEPSCVVQLPTKALVYNQNNTEARRPSHYYLLGEACPAPVETEDGFLGQCGLPRFLSVRDQQVSQPRCPLHGGGSA